MSRLTAAVLTAAAVAIAAAGMEVYAADDAAVRAEVAVAGEGHPLGVLRIRILDALRPGESYRLPPFAVRNHRSIRTAYRLVVFDGAAQAEKQPPRRWLGFVRGAVVIDAGQSRAVGMRLELPDDAEPGAYAVALRVRPGGSEGARLMFRIEPAESTLAWLRQAANLAMWVVPTFVGAVLVLARFRAGNRGQQTGSERPNRLRSVMRNRGSPKSWS